MRERITFAHPQDGGVDPKELKLDRVGLNGPAIESIREDRLAIPLDELPSELADLLKHTTELHLRWISPVEYATVEPFSSRLSPGLHVFYNPYEDDAEFPIKLCTLLQLFGEVDCKSKESFIDSTPNNVGKPSGLYFYHKLEDLRPFIAATTPNFCSNEDTLCRARLQGLSIASSLDISFDAASGILKLSSFAPLREQALIVPSSPLRRTEVGIFGAASPPNIEPHQIGVSGVLVVLGEHKEPSPTLFSFPARHRLSADSFSSKFLSPTGLHPALQISLTSNQPPVQDVRCAPHAYLTLPNAIFADRYQLDDELFLKSKNLTSSKYISNPVDLEAPAYTTAAWGSNVLLELSPPSSEGSQPWTAEVPLHLRYLKPSVTGETEAEVPYPVVFWACESGDGADFANNPFDRLQLGYDNLFSPTTSFWHVNPGPQVGERITNRITVPVLKEEGAELIRLGTAAVVSLGFAWVLWKLATVYLKTGYEAPKPKVQDKKKKK